MDADRRSAVLTGTFFILGTVLGLVGLGVVLAPLLGATDYLTAYRESETRVLLASLLELLTGVALIGIAKGFDASALASVNSPAGAGGTS